MTREFGPLGIHVAHIVIDDGIAGGKLLNPYPQLAEERSEDGLLSIEGIAENVLSDPSPAALSLDPRD